MRPTGSLLPSGRSPRVAAADGDILEKIAWAGRLFTWTFLAPIPRSSTVKTTHQSHPFLPPSTTKQATIPTPHPNSLPSSQAPSTPNPPPAPTRPPATSRHQPPSKHLPTRQAHTTCHHPPSPPLRRQKRGKNLPLGASQLVKQYGRVLFGRVLFGADWRQDVVGSNRAETALGCCSGSHLRNPPACPGPTWEWEADVQLDAAQGRASGDDEPTWEWEADVQLDAPQAGSSTEPLMTWHISISRNMSSSARQPPINQSLAEKGCRRYAVETG